MNIRKLEKNDINQVIEIWTNSFSINFDKPINHNYLSDPNSITIVMSEKNIVIGVATLHIIKKLTRILGLIEDVAVNKNYRGLGIGKKTCKRAYKNWK